MQWNRQNAGPIGIDFGARSIRAVQLRRRADDYELVAAHEKTLDPDAALNQDAVASAVRALLAEGHFAGKHVATCLPAADVELRSIRLPNMPAEELAAAAEFEARERFPSLQGDQIIRAIPAGEVGRPGDEQQEVLILAARPELIEGRLKLLTGLGLTVTGMEAPATAFFRPFERFLQRSSDAVQSNAFVDIGWRSTRVIITRGQDIVFMKACPQGGEVFDEQLAKQMSMTVREAAEHRRQCWAPDHPELSPACREKLLEALRGPIEQLGKEISLCLRYYAVTFRGDRPDQVVCGGSEATLPPLLEMLSGVAQLPFAVGNAFRSIACGTALDARALETGLPTWTAAAGLALRPRMGA